MGKYKVVFSTGSEIDFCKMLKEYYFTDKDFTIIDNKIVRSDGWTPKIILFRLKNNRYQAITEVL